MRVVSFQTQTVSFSKAQALDRGATGFAAAYPSYKELSGKRNAQARFKVALALAFGFGAETAMDAAAAIALLQDSAGDDRSCALLGFLRLNDFKDEKRVESAREAWSAAGAGVLCRFVLQCGIAGFAPAAAASAAAKADNKGDSKTETKGAGAVESKGDTKADAAVGKDTAQSLLLEVEQMAQHDEDLAQFLLAEHYATLLNPGGASKSGGTVAAGEHCVYWARRAAERGNLAAASRLAVCYEAGAGVTKDAAKACELAQKAAAFGFAPALLVLARATADQKTAWQYRVKAVAACVPEAFLEAALVLHVGNAAAGVAQDSKRAVELAQMAAHAGVVRAQNTVGCWLVDGAGVCKDWKAGVAWLQKAAAAGDNAARRTLAHISTSEQDKVTWLKQAIAAGDSLAKFRLSKLILDGKVLQVRLYPDSYSNQTTADTATGERLLQEAADAGCAEALFELGSRVIAKWSRSHTGLALLERAAEQGSVEACNAVAKLWDYFRGDDMLYDVCDAAAGKWLLRARALGQAELPQWAQQQLRNRPIIAAALGVKPT